MAFLVPDRTVMLNGVTVKEYFLTEHNVNHISMPQKRVKPLKGITIHNTEAIRVNGTTMAEQYTRATVNGNMNTVRVHYYVDNVEVWQNLPLDYQSWHAADGSGDGNSATISIECIMSSSGYEKSEDNCARLVAYLLKTYGLTTDAVYTHTYWLHVRDGLYPDMDKDTKCCTKHPYKTCPIYIIPHWWAFLKKVNEYMNVTKLETAPEVSDGYLYKVQTGAFSSKSNASEHLKEVRKHFPDAVMVKQKLN